MLSEAAVCEPRFPGCRGESAQAQLHRPCPGLASRSPARPPTREASQPLHTARWTVPSSTVRWPSGGEQVSGGSGRRPWAAPSGTPVHPPRPPAFWRREEPQDHSSPGGSPRPGAGWGRASGGREPEVTRAPPVPQDASLCKPVCGLEGTRWGGDPLGPWGLSINQDRVRPCVELTVQELRAVAKGRGQSLNPRTLLLLKSFPPEVPTSSAPLHSAMLGGAFGL